MLLAIIRRLRGRCPIDGTKVEAWSYNRGTCEHGHVLSIGFWG